MRRKSANLFVTKSRARTSCIKFSQQRVRYASHKILISVFLILAIAARRKCADCAERICGNIPRDNRARDADTGCECDDGRVRPTVDGPRHYGNGGARIHPRGDGAGVARAIPITSESDYN